MRQGRRARARRAPARAIRARCARVAPEPERMAGMGLHGERDILQRGEIGNSDVIWNERASPSRLRSWTGSAVMSRPSKWMRPASGAISPASWPISVVLPAPFGPMMACSSPAATSSATSSEATTPPKRLVRPSICEQRVSHGAPRDQHAVDAAAREEHDQQQHRSENDLPVFRRLHRTCRIRRLTTPIRRQRLLQQQERDRADHRAEHRAHAAQHRHHDQVAGAGPEHHRRADEVGVVGEQHAGKPAHHAGNDEAGRACSGRSGSRWRACAARSSARPGSPCRSARCTSRQTR